MRSPSALLPALLLALRAAAGAEPAVPTPQGFVTDEPGSLGTAARARLTRLADELAAKTGAEIAIVTVETTRPLDDFTYALRIAEAWRPGRAAEDTGVVFLVAVADRKVRILVGYGLEEILPDGRVGEIIDREVVPEFRAGRFDKGVLRGVTAVAEAVAAARGVPLTGTPPPRPLQAPGWVPLLVFLVLLALVLYQASRPNRFRRGRVFVPWGFGGPFGGGGFGGGGGGFGGFGGGSFGGGGGGRSW